MNYGFFILCTKVSLPEVEKCIKIEKSGQILLWIFGKEIQQIELNLITATTVEEFLFYIKLFESIGVCHGGPKVDLFPGAPFMFYVLYQFLET